MEVRGAEKLISTSFQPNADSLLGSISNAFQDQQVKNLALRNVYDQSSLGITDFKVDGFYGLPSAGADPSLVTKVIMVAVWYGNFVCLHIHRIKIMLMDFS